MSDVKFCRAYFEELCNTNPEELADLVISGQLRPSDLTFAAEWLGRSSSPRAHSILESLALDEKQTPVAREGAFYGLLHLGVDVQSVLISFSKSASSGLRFLAKDHK